jgi:hypothetical protein
LFPFAAEVLQIMKIELLETIRFLYFFLQRIGTTGDASSSAESSVKIVNQGTAKRGGSIPVNL